MSIYRIYGRSRAAAGANKRVRFSRSKFSQTMLLYQSEGIIYNYVVFHFDNLQLICSIDMR